MRLYFFNSVVIANSKLDYLRNRKTAERLCVTNVTGLKAFVFCCDLHLTSMFSGLLQKDLLKGR